MGLALGLLVTALYFYRYAALTDQEMKKSEKRAFASRQIQSRLSKVFLGLKNPHFFSLPEEPGLTKGPSLVFSCCSESRRQLFLGKVLARLFVDSQNRLILAFWQDNARKNQDEPPGLHLEVLLENVEGMQFEFLIGDPPPTGRQPGLWVKEWPQDTQSKSPLPRALKILLQSKENLEYAFPLPLSRGDK